MPFQSEAQRRYLYVHHPEIAARWTKEGDTPKSLPKHVGRTRVVAALLRRQPRGSGKPKGD